MGATQGWPDQQMSAPLGFVIFHSIYFYVFIYAMYNFLLDTYF